MHILFHEKVVYERGTKIVKELLEFEVIAMRSLHFNDKSKDNVHN